MSKGVQPRMHAWHIEDREYARQEQRRGRRHAYERVTPERTALVVIDMVPFFFEANEFCRGIVPNIQHLASALRDAGGTVAWVLPGPTAPTGADEEFLGPETARLFATAGGTGPLRQRIWQEFEIADDDILVEKNAASAFFPGRSPLPEMLEARAIETVLITGTVTNVCCESSARDASTLGYRVIMVADANAARRDEDHNSALYTIYRSFGDVRPTRDVIKLIQGAARGNPA